MMCDFSVWFHRYCFLVSWDVSVSKVGDVSYLRYVRSVSQSTQKGYQGQQ